MILDIIIITSTGTIFSKLAKQFGKNRFLNAALGVVFFYAIFFAFTIITGFILGFNNPELINDKNVKIVSFCCIPLAVIATYFFYQFLKRKWSKTPIDENTEIIDSNINV